MALKLTSFKGIVHPKMKTLILFQTCIIYMFFLIVVVWVNYPFKEPCCLIKKRPELCKMHQLIITLLIFFWGFVYVFIIQRSVMATVLFSAAEGARISGESLSLAVKQREKPSHVSGGGGRERDRLFHLLATRHVIGLMVHSREVNSFRLSGKMPSAISAAITPVLSVKCTSRNHSNMLVWCLRNITYYY